MQNRGWVSTLVELTHHPQSVHLKQTWMCRNINFLFRQKKKFCRASQLSTMLVLGSRKRRVFGPLIGLRPQIAGVCQLESSESCTSTIAFCLARLAGVRDFPSCPKRPAMKQTTVTRGHLMPAPHETDCASDRVLRASTVRTQLTCIDASGARQRLSENWAISQRPKEITRSSALMRMI